MIAHIHGPFDGIPTLALIFAGFVIGSLALGFGFIFYLIAKSIVVARRNSRQPVVNRRASVVGRRLHVWGDSARTDYYLTFQFEDGTREEYRLSSAAFGLIAEGDTGILSTQGTAFKGFDRAAA